MVYISLLTQPIRCNFMSPFICQQTTIIRLIHQRERASERIRPLDSNSTKAYRPTNPQVIYARCVLAGDFACVWVCALHETTCRTSRQSSYTHVWTKIVAFNGEEVNERKRRNITVNAAHHWGRLERGKNTHTHSFQFVCNFFSL